MKSFHGLTSKLQTRSVLSVAIKESEKLQNWPLGKNRGNANVRGYLLLSRKAEPQARVWRRTWGPKRDGTGLRG